LAPRRILITGATGLLGSKILKECKTKSLPVFTAGRRESDIGLDIIDSIAWKNLIPYIDPDTIVIHCAADTNVDTYEEDDNLYWKTIGLVRYLCLLCEDTNSKLIFISTDFVFSDRLAPYRPYEDPCPINRYGLAKAKCEEIIRNSSMPSRIYRTSTNFSGSRSDKNFYSRLIRSIDDGKVFTAFADVICQPTYTPTAAKIIISDLDFLSQETLHLTAPASISKYSFARALASVSRRDTDLIKPISIRSIKLKAARPTRVSLVSSYPDRMELYKSLLDLRLYQ
jgi:dTDP-4-dehydrorhamnose reductase